jgi:hypothetical protein
LNGDCAKRIERLSVDGGTEFVRRLLGDQEDMDDIVEALWKVKKNIQEIR